MEKNLFKQAKDMVANLTNMNNNQGDHVPNESDKEAAKQAIQAAYQDATPEQQEQLNQFQQQLDEKIN